MRINVLLLFILVALCLISCRKDPSIGAKQTLNVALTAEVPSLDPALSYDTVSATVLYQAYETLYEYHYLKRPYTLQPLLAVEMPKIEKDGKRYVIKIKQNVSYHNHPAFKGKKRYVKAEDFITQFKRIAYVKTHSNGWWLFDRKIKGINEFREKTHNFEEFKKNTISGITAPNDNTLIIDLNEPYPQFLYALAMTFTTPIPLEVVEHHDNLILDEIVGTGPFKLKKSDDSTKITLIKNKSYRDATYPSQGDRFTHDKSLLDDAGQKIPFLDEVVFHIIKEPTTRWYSFRNKKLDFLSLPKDNFSNAIKADGALDDELLKDGIKLEIATTLTYWWLAFNMKDELLGKNKYLRLAIAHAIDFDRYINIFTNNTGQRANSIYPPGIPGYDPASTLPYKFDLTKANEYLKLAGYPNGKGLPVITFDARGTSTIQRQQAEFIQGELRKIGINIQIETNSFPHFLEKERNNRLQFWVGGWAMDYPDAENVLQLLLTKNHSPGPNSSLYNNPQFDSLFEKLKTQPDGIEKYELMKELEAIIHQDLPWIMNYYTRLYILYHDHLKNYRHSDLIYNSMKYLRVIPK